MKTHIEKKGLILILFGLLIMPLAIPAFPQDKHAQITIRVDGLTCPFCAYGLEKKLKRLEGVEKVRIDIDRGIAEVTVAEGKFIQEEELKKAVLNAGFTPKDIIYHTVKP
ncbi:MAG: heavy-metal-associated domain-containing protein [Nitrospiria bacterium]